MSIHLKVLRGKTATPFSLIDLSIWKIDIPSVDYNRKRKTFDDYRRCPELFLLKLELKRYSSSTVKTYVSFFELFVNHFKTKDLIEINEQDIRLFLHGLIQQNKSNSYINQMINSIKFYYEVVMEMPNRFYNVERPFKKKSLPKVISKQEVKAIINNTSNIKHRCIVSLLFSTGIRRAELLNLKLDDIDSYRMIVHVKNGKGNKDRITMLSESVLKDLRIYFKEWKPQVYLFENPKGGQYSGTSVNALIKKAAQKAHMKIKVSPHTLRHSFATHLLEDGVDIRYIQSLLGHNSTRTTETYTHVATNQIISIKNPIDSLNLD